jgi:hypothetical protein
MPGASAGVQHHGIALVGGDGGDDVGALHGRMHAVHHLHLNPIRAANGARLRCSLALAARSTSNRRSSRTPSSSIKAKAWNSLWRRCRSAPRRLPGRASVRATMTEVAAVRKAVVSVSSLTKRGMPVATSASAPKAITVGKPCGC